MNEIIEMVPLVKKKEHETERQNKIKALQFPESIYPETGIIKDYIEFADPITEAPREFLLTGGMMLVSAIIQDNLYYIEGDSKIKLNLYVVLTGRSSETKKTTSVNIPKRILQEMENRTHHKYLFPSKVTPEAFYSILSGTLEDKQAMKEQGGKEPIYIKPQTRGLMIYSEFGELTAYFKKDYAGGFKETLTSAYDDSPPDEIGTKGMGIIKPRTDYISIFAASTPEWISSNLKPDDLLSGFLGRFLFVYGEPSDKVFPFRKQEDKALKEEIFKSLLELSEIKNMTIELPEDTRNLYIDWYMKDKQRFRNLDIELQPFYSRHRDYVKKIAAIYQIAEDRSEVISHENMQRAIDFIEVIRRQTAYLVSELFKSKEAKFQEEMIDFIRDNPFCSRTDIHDRFKRRGAEKITRVLDALEKAGLIKCETSDTKTAGRPKELYHVL